MAYRILCLVIFWTTLTAGIEAKSEPEPYNTTPVPEDPDYVAPGDEVPEALADTAKLSEKLEHIIYKACSLESLGLDEADYPFHDELKNAYKNNKEYCLNIDDNRSEDILNCFLERFDEVFEVFNDLKDRAWQCGQKKVEADRDECLKLVKIFGCANDKIIRMDNAYAPDDDFEVFDYGH